MSQMTFLDEVESKLNHDSATRIRCSTREDAQALTDAIYDRFSAEVFQLEHYPVTDDEAGIVAWTDVIVRQVYYDEDLGWFGSDAPATPELEYDPQTTDISP